MSVGRREVSHFQLWLMKTLHGIPALVLLPLPVATAGDNSHRVGEAGSPKDGGGTVSPHRSWTLHKQDRGSTESSQCDWQV